jgi:elongation factor Ts
MGRKRLKIPVVRVKELREQSGAGVMDCRKALVKAAGDTGKALQILREEGLLLARKKAERSATEGVIEAYVHCGGHIGAMIEVNCETDFVARTEEFKGLAHNLAMQVAAMNPQFISEDEVPEEAGIEPQASCLLLQPYIKDNSKTVQDIIIETIARLGENIKVGRFAKFELGRD